MLMLSEAKHLRLFRWWIDPDLIRDGKPGLAPKAFGATLQLRAAQNDISLSGARCPQWNQLSLH